MSSYYSSEPPTPKGDDKSGSFQCTLCNKTFTRNSSLLNHAASHSSDKKYKCDICPQLFSRENDQKRHVKLQHNPRQYRCGGGSNSGQKWGCGKAFKRRDGLKEHWEKSKTGQKCAEAKLKFSEIVDSPSMKLAGEHFDTTATKQISSVGDVHDQARILFTSQSIHSQLSGPSKEEQLVFEQKIAAINNNAPQPMDPVIASTMSTWAEQRTMTSMIKSFSSPQLGCIVSPQLTCIVCWQSFISFQHLQAHVFEHSRGLRKPKYYCWVCKTSFSLQSTFQSHWAEEKKCGGDVNFCSVEYSPGVNEVLFARKKSWGCNQHMGEHASLSNQVSGRLDANGISHKHDSEKCIPQLRAIEEEIVLHALNHLTMIRYGTIPFFRIIPSLPRDLREYATENPHTLSSAGLTD
jgi:hypothetical protein